MTSHDWFIEQRNAYVAKALDPEEEKAFADHLLRCDECRTAVAEIERDLGWLPMGVRPVPPPPGFRWRAAEAALGRSRRPRAAIWLPLAAAAVLLAAVGLRLRSVGVRLEQESRRADQLAADLARSEQALDALGDTVTVLRRAAKVLQASIEMDDHRGNLMIFADDVSHRWNVVLHGLPPAPNGEKYQFWFITSDGMVRGAELAPTGDGSLILTLGMPERGGQVLGAALSVEPLANASDTPKGKELAHLML
ncbi:MAG: anti-sigma factor [Gemmatimonadales bacterium]